MTSEKKFQEMVIAGIASDNRNLQPVVILKEKGGERELYIWIGPVEAMAASLEMVLPPAIDLLMALSVRQQPWAVPVHIIIVELIPLVVREPERSSWW